MSYACLLGLFLAVALQAQEIVILNVTNAATFDPGMPRGGALASIFCTGLTGISGTVAAATSNPLPRMLAGVSVRINDGTAAILSVSQLQDYQQINIQVPAERDAGLPAFVRVDVFQGSSRGGSYNAPYSAFGGFFTGADGYAVAQHAVDHTAVTKANPARPGETITAYTTGLLPSWPPPPIAVPVPSTPLFAADTSFVSATNATLLFVGLSPGSAGLGQVNFVIPEDASPGDFRLSIEVLCNMIDVPCQTSSHAYTSTVVPVGQGR
jgi:uncharacterized protein (TIGR03437 family)